MTCTRAFHKTEEVQIWKNYSQLTMGNSTQHESARFAAGESTEWNQEQRKITSSQAQAKENQLRDSHSASQEAPNASVKKDLGNDRC